MICGCLTTGVGRKQAPETSKKEREKKIGRCGHIDTIPKSISTKLACNEGLKTQSLVPSLALACSASFVWLDVENGRFLYLLSTAHDTVYGAAARACDLRLFPS
jgi:hypothetical protein